MTKNKIYIIIFIKAWRSSMTKVEKTNYITTAVLFTLFIIFTIIIATVDVQSIGPNDSLVGLASINGSMFTKLGTSDIWGKVTDIICVISIMTAIPFAILGIIQLIKEKRIKSVDPKIIMLGIFYVVVIVVYIIFEVLVVNYRPVLVDGVLEASYPSSHTMIVICFLSSTILLINMLIFNKKIIIATDVVGIALMIIAVVGRLLSGMHWITDIIGSVLISTALTMLLYSVIVSVEKKTIEKTV